MASTLPLPNIAPGGLPLVGHGLAMKRRAGDFLLSLQTGDPVIRIHMGKSHMYVVNDPDLIREVLRAPEPFARGGPVMDRFRTMFGNGLGISEGEFHRRQRALIQPAFHHKRIIAYSSLMSDQVASMLGSWRDGQRRAVDRDMDELALANVTHVIFADDSGLDHSRFMEATTIVLGGLFRRITDTTGLLTRLPTPGNRRYQRAVGYLRGTIDKLISDYRNSGVDHGDLLSMMVMARDDSGQPAMTEKQLHDEVMTFFIGGSNTVSNTLSWALHEIATHPDVEKRLHEEVDKMLAGRSAAHADIEGLDYTRRVLTETLRVRTQGLFLSRVTTSDAELGGYRIPAGASVLYSFYALNHNPAIHSDPELFDPDRWLPERARSIPRGAFMPFGVGVHGCIGDQFTWAEMIISLATITARWRLVSVPGHRPRPKPAITMPLDALPMEVRHRGKQQSQLRRTRSWETRS